MLARYALAVVTALIVASATPALAQSGAPYCSGLSCAYFDLQSCQRAAGSGGMCRVNPTSAKAKDFKGGGSICGVSATGGNCFYFDLKACQAAVGPGGSCVGAPRK